MSWYWWIREFTKLTIRKQSDESFYDEKAIFFHLIYDKNDKKQLYVRVNINIKTIN